jgi:SPP1 gp7 family putative phage head morphogenesis protein
MQGERWEPFFGGRGRHPGWREARRRWSSARRAETQYGAMLRRVARHIDDIVRGIFNPDNPDDPGWSAIEAALRLYERTIEPWAHAASSRMLADVGRRDAAAWHQLGQQVNRALKREIATTPTGPAWTELQASQVHLIKSLPREAAERVHRLSEEAVVGGKRWTEVAQAVLDQGDVSRSKANLIGRTETARAASNLQAIRAQHVGSEYFQWMTSGDADVRPLHRKIGREHGGVYRWDDPPILDDGKPGLPGTIWNCRCIAAPIVDAEDVERRRARGQVPVNPEFLEALRQRGYTKGALFDR